MTVKNRSGENQLYREKCWYVYTISAKNLSLGCELLILYKCENFSQRKKQPCNFEGTQNDTAYYQHLEELTDTDFGLSRPGDRTHTISSCEHIPYYPSLGTEPILSRPGDRTHIIPPWGQNP